MAQKWTTRGLRQALKWAIQNDSPPAALRLILVTSAVAATEDTLTLSELTEITAGNGYTAGGISLTRNTTNFPNLAEDTVTDDDASVDIEEQTWTTSGGAIPSAGGGINQAVLTDGTLGTDSVIAYFDVPGAPLTLTLGQELTLKSGQLVLQQPV